MSMSDDSGLKLRGFRLDDSVLKEFSEKLGVEVDHLWKVLTELTGDKDV